MCLYWIKTNGILDGAKNYFETAGDDAQAVYDCLFSLVWLNSIQLKWDVPLSAGVHQRYSNTESSNKSKAIAVPLLSDY